MKRTILVAIILVGALGVSGYTIQHVFFNQQVSATGYLQPESATQLNFATSAPIAEVDVAVGDVVRAGHVLAKQNTTALKAKLAALEAALAAHQAALAFQKDPQRGQELQALQAATAVAQARVDAAQARATESARVQNVLVTNAANAVQAARSTLAADEQVAAGNAVACSSVVAPTASSNVSALEAGVDGAPPITLPSVLAPSPARMASCNQLARQITQDQARVTQAVGAYNEAIAKRQSSAATAAPELTQAQRQLDLAVARESTGTPVSTPITLASAQAAVSKDMVDIEEAHAALDAAVLVAPTDGVVSGVGGARGEVAGPEGVRVFGGPQALPQKESSGINLFPQAPRQLDQKPSQFDSMITLGSSSVDVLAQVGENDVRALRSAARARITFPAIPGETFTGYVSRVHPQAVNIDGNVYFLVEVSLTRQPRAPSHAPRVSERNDVAQPSSQLVGLTANVRF